MPVTDRTAILHVGLPKTGSTAIQGFMADHRGLLREHGAHFAEAPGRKNHAMLAAYALGERARLSLQRRAAAVSSEQEVFESNLPGMIAEELRSLPDSIHTVIYSSEMLGGSVRSVEHAERLKGLFAPHFSAIRVVVYLRRQDEAAVSSYSTQLKAGGRARFQILRDADSLRRYEYHRVLDIFSGGFGESAVLPRIFDRSLLVGGDVVKDFLAACGLADIEVTAESSALVRGAALRADVQELLRRFNDLMAERNLVGRRAIASIVGDAELRGKPRLPTRGEAEAFFHQFADGNENIRNRFFPDRATLFNEDFGRYPETDDGSAYSDSKVLDVALEVLARVAPQLARLDVETTYLRGEVAEAKGDIEEAKAFYLRAAQSVVGHRRAREALARMGVKSGDFRIVDSEDGATGVDLGHEDSPHGGKKKSRKRDDPRKQTRKKRREDSGRAPGNTEKAAEKAERKARRQAKRANR